MILVFTLVSDQQIRLVLGKLCGKNKGHLKRYVTLIFFFCHLLVKIKGLSHKVTKKKKQTTVNTTNLILCNSFFLLLKNLSGSKGLLLTGLS